MEMTFRKSGMDKINNRISATERYSLLRNRISDKVLVFDGAMGTSLHGQNLPDTAYGACPRLNEYLNLSSPAAVSKVHDGFLSVGCDVIETNTFQGSSIKLAEYGLEDKSEEINRVAASIAVEAALKFSTLEHPRFVAGSIGPTGALPSSGDPNLDTIPLDKLRDTFYQQARALVLGDGSNESPNGVDILVVETGQDLLEQRQAVLAIDKLRKDLGLNIPLLVSFTFDSTGRMLLGSVVESSLASFLDLPIDIIGLNCATGPDEMREAMRYLGEKAPMWVSAMPNAGLPCDIDGCMSWPLLPEKLAASHKEFVGRFKVSIVGGCCGTTPAHLKAVVDAIGSWKPAPRPRHKPQLVASPLAAVDLDEIPTPVIVGERLNAQGSKKAKKSVLAQDIDGLFSIAASQVDDGAAILDVSLAVSEQSDEAALMERVVTRLTSGIKAPLMIDTTDPDVVAHALDRIPGRAIVNSINFEGGEDRARKTFDLLKRNGGLVVCLTIDEQGMAFDIKRKRAIARRIALMAQAEYGISPDRLIFDPLTFTLATGEELYRNSAINTLQGLREIKRDLPESRTILGISNCSYGLPAASRKILNSVFLYHAVRAGLDFAIVHAGQVTPYSAISQRERKLAEDLLFDRHPDSLAQYIAYFEQKTSTDETPLHPVAQLPPEEGLRQAVLHREKDGIDSLIDRALETHSPESILNDILLPAMQEVGNKMASGETILPFVLQSAEVMKAAVARLEPYMAQNGTHSRGKIVLATVAGDVHDIGKNLVKTILQNNGYDVLDLGKQVPISAIVAKAREFGADILGLSALLVTTSRQMEYAVEEMHRAGLEIPVIIGGAAINRLFARRISWIGKDEIYTPGVFYAEDAFKGLQFVQGLMDPNERKKLQSMAEEGARLFRENRDKQALESAAKMVVIEPVPSIVRHDNEIPTPSFWGKKTIETVDLKEIYQLLDTKVLFKLNWGIRGRTADEYHSLVHSTFEPLLDDLQKEAQRHAWLLPSAVYGYFPASADGNDVVLYEPPSEGCQPSQDREIGRFTFPRQTKGEHLCVADYFHPLPKKPNGEKCCDMIALQVVTMGDGVSEVVRSFTQSGEYAKGFFLHGLAMECAEALAEWLHRRIKEELGIDRGQGHRYSFGYPSCPDLAHQKTLFQILDAENAIGTHLTSAYQIVPEQSTSAFIVHHPDARYFHIEGMGMAGVLREPLG
jgi:5-methyltetrahydrofolate--homocysteine methyltransferase